MGHKIEYLIPPIRDFEMEDVQAAIDKCADVFARKTALPIKMIMETTPRASWVDLARREKINIVIESLLNKR